MPPRVRPASNPWPQWPLVLRNHAAHEEGGVRAFGIEVVGFEGDADGRVRGIDVVDVDRSADAAGGRGLTRRAGLAAPAGRPAGACEVLAGRPPPGCAGRGWWS